jgi:hypothetical protein
VFLTRPPLPPPSLRKKKVVRLACVRHAASVYPEPGSNSPSKSIDESLCGDSNAICISLPEERLDAQVCHCLTGYLLAKICSIWFLTTLQLFRYTADAFASLAPLQFPVGASEMIPPLVHDVKGFCEEKLQFCKNLFSQNPSISNQKETVASISRTFMLNNHDWGAKCYSCSEGSSSASFTLVMRVRAVVLSGVEDVPSRSR